MFNFFIFFFLIEILKNEKLCSIFIFFFLEHTKMKNLWSILIFFCTQNGNETNPEVKKAANHDTIAGFQCHAIQNRSK